MTEDIQTPELMINEDKHHAFNKELSDVIIKHGQILRPVELIAIVSNTLGGLVSLLPDDAVQGGYALDLIQRNLEKGNSDTNELLQPLKLLVSTEKDTNEIH